MGAARTERRGLRRAAIATIAGIAFAGVTLIGATSATAAGTGSSGCLATSSNSVLASGLASGLLDCITGGTGSPTTVPTTAPAAPDATTPPIAPVPPVEVPVPSTDSTSPAPVVTVVPSPAPATPAASGELRTVQVITTTETVYPSAKGWSKSSVRFSIRGLTASSAGVRITGSAVLRKGAQVVKNWSIDDATTTLSWDGRNGTRVDPGRYVLTVVAWSSDGSRAMATMRVRVSAEHLVTRTVSMRTRDLARVHREKLPVAVMKALSYGTVCFRIHTVAKVSGTARLIISGPYGDRISMPLRNGTHVTRSAVLPRTVTSAAFHHQWRAGAAKLVELDWVFTYKELV